jgi:tetratricopeptide (TPR) repeat protein
MKMLHSLLFGLVLTQLSSCFWFSFGDRPSHARAAAQLRSEKKYDQAISEYEQHISARLSDSRREPEENPYFYLILIGDIYLEQGKIDAALDKFIEAKEKEVEIPLVVDRIRRVGKTLHDQGKFREAVDLLQKYRGLDEFVFDLDIDENLKAIVKEEDGKSRFR